MKTHPLLPPALAMLGLLAAAAPFVAPVAVQAQRTERVLTIFGNDKCPTDTEGNEIVVCRRLPENERQRIPQELRSENRDRQSAGERAATLDSVGKSGAQSCSPSGVAGASGCFRERARAACDEDKAKGGKCGIGF